MWVPISFKQKSRIVTQFLLFKSCLNKLLAHHLKDKKHPRLHARQQEAMQSQRSTDKQLMFVIRKYRDATDIVDLLAGNQSILIDFQYDRSPSKSLFGLSGWGTSTF